MIKNKIFVYDLTKAAFMHFITTMYRYMQHIEIYIVYTDSVDTCTIHIYM